MNSAFQAVYADLANQAPPGDASPLFATVAPYLDFDFQTNRVILNAEQNFYDEMYTTLSTVNSVKIYFNERLYDLFVGGVPCEFDTGEFKYRLRVV